jgi:glycosyltransferase involved in cell wall biosynthesis
MLDRFHGIGRYVYNIVWWGLQNRTDAEIGVLTLRPERWDDTVRQFPALTVFPCLARPFRPREHAELPRRIQRFRPDLVHFPSLAAPLWCPAPFVMTVHDLIPWHFGNILHRTYIQTFGRWSMSRARRVITASQHARGDLRKVLHLPPERTRVIPNGGLDGGTLSGAPANVKLQRPYVLCVTNDKAHKNVDAVLQAWQSMVFPCDLLLVAPEAVRQRVQGVPGVLQMSDVSDQQLRELYSDALAVIVPSLYEGFGLPALEAMQCGAPVLSSNASSLPEVVGEAGLYFDPRNPSQIAGRLREVLQSPELRADLRRRSAEQARKFSWDQSGRQHWELFSEVTRKS